MTDVSTTHLVDIEILPASVLYRQADRLAHILLCSYGLDRFRRAIDASAELELRLRKFLANALTFRLDGLALVGPSMQLLSLGVQN